MLEICETSSNIVFIWYHNFSYIKCTHNTTIALNDCWLLFNKFVAFRIGIAYTNRIDPALQQTQLKLMGYATGQDHKMPKLVRISMLSAIQVSKITQLLIFKWVFAWIYTTVLYWSATSKLAIASIFHAKYGKNLYLPTASNPSRHLSGRYQFKWMTVWYYTIESRFKSEELIRHSQFCIRIKLYNCAQTFSRLSVCILPTSWSNAAKSLVMFLQQSPQEAISISRY